jgi:hypothetical protein
MQIAVVAVLSVVCIKQNRQNSSFAVLGRYDSIGVTQPTYSHFRLGEATSFVRTKIVVKPTLQLCLPGTSVTNNNNSYY